MARAAVVAVVGAWLAACAGADGPRPPVGTSARPSAHAPTGAPAEPDLAAIFASTVAGVLYLDRDLGEFPDARLMHVPPGPDTAPVELVRARECNREPRGCAYVGRLASWLADAAGMTRLSVAPWPARRGTVGEFEVIVGEPTFRILHPASGAEVELLRLAPPLAAPLIAAAPWPDGLALILVSEDDRRHHHEVVAVGPPPVGNAGAPPLPRPPATAFDLDLVRYDATARRYLFVEQSVNHGVGCCVLTLDGGPRGPIRTHVLDAFDCAADAVGGAAVRAFAAELVAADGFAPTTAAAWPRPHGPPDAVVRLADLQLEWDGARIRVVDPASSRASAWRPQMSSTADVPLAVAYAAGADDVVITFGNPTGLVEHMLIARP
ncbi:MAG: hypothetical protein R2939_14785 [Kofleriaceae bacterium]